MNINRWKNNQIRQILNENEWVEQDASRGKKAVKKDVMVAYDSLDKALDLADEVESVFDTLGCVLDLADEAPPPPGNSDYGTYKSRPCTRTCARTC